MFTIGGAPAPEEEDEPETGDVAMAGHAWIGGTFINEDGEFDWIPWEDQKVAFTVGEQFTVTLDLGSDTQTHGEASWGYITVVQTDIMDPAMFYDAFIEDILVDGSSVSFNPANIEVGFDEGVRISLTNGWSDDPVIAGPQVIGTFSKLEVVMTFALAGDEPIEAPGVEEPPAQVEPPPPIERPTEEPKKDGLPGWVLPVIIGGVAVIAVVVVLVVVKSKKKA